MKILVPSPPDAGDRSVVLIRDIRTAPYRPGGLPLYWKDEQSGSLARAVRAWIDYRCGLSAAPHPEDLQKIADWLYHYVNAPCWRGDLGDLRERAEKLRTADEIAQWVHDALDYGLDPL